MHKEIGIDLGGTTMLVCTAEGEIIAREPTVTSIVKENNRLYSIGREALDDVQDPSKGLYLFYPVRAKGLIGDDAATRTMVSYLIHLTCGNLIIKPRVLMGIPFDLKEEEETLLEYTILHSGAREAFLVYTPVAAMIGMDIPSEEAVMIVDIGATHTNLMLTGDGKILYKNTVHVGGDQFNRAIMDYLEKKHRIRINSRSAEGVKTRIGTVWINREERALDVRGINEEGAVAGVRISSREMFEALEEPTACLISAICEAIDKIPSAYVGAVFHRGILLCGGGACLDGLDKMISGVTGVNTRVVDRPGDVVAIGLGKILSDLPTAMKNEDINISSRCFRAEL